VFEAPKPQWDGTFLSQCDHPGLCEAWASPGFPTAPEFIVPQYGSEKQYCERAAAKRWLSQHHQHFDDYSVTYLGDDLYANQPLCQLIVETYRQFFIFVCKPQSHEGLYAWLDFLDKNGGIETLQNDIGMANLVKSGNIVLPARCPCAMAMMLCRSIGWN
jgi:hypothetical protein